MILDLMLCKIRDFAKQKQKAHGLNRGLSVFIILFYSSLKLENSVASIARIIEKKVVHSPD
jgi:hypothetical protein